MIAACNSTCLQSVLVVGGVNVLVETAIQSYIHTCIYTYIKPSRHHAPLQVLGEDQTQHGDNTDSLAVRSEANVFSYGFWLHIASSLHTRVGMDQVITKCWFAAADTHDKHFTATHSQMMPVEPRTLSRMTTFPKRVVFMQGWAGKNSTGAMAPGQAAIAPCTRHACGTVPHVAWRCRLNWQHT